ERPGRSSGAGHPGVAWADGAVATPTLTGMARSPFTLAALAAAAVPGLTAVGVTPLRDEDFDAAVVSAADGRELLVRLPRSRETDTRIRAELAGLAALTAGARSRLPFAVLTPEGAATYGPTRAVVTDYPA